MTKISRIILSFVYIRQKLFRIFLLLLLSFSHSHSRKKNYQKNYQHFCWYSLPCYTYTYTDIGFLVPNLTLIRGKFNGLLCLFFSCDLSINFSFVLLRILFFSRRYRVLMTEPDILNVPILFFFHVKTIYHYYTKYALSNVQNMLKHISEFFTQLWIC